MNHPDRAFFFMTKKAPTTLGSIFAASAIAEAKKKIRAIKYVGTVGNSVEFQRIKSLPRRAPDFDNVDDVTPMFAKSGELTVWPIQSAMLIEAAISDGLFAAVGVGFGKTLACLLLPIAMDSHNAVILVKTELKKQLEREIKDFYGVHFHIPEERFTIVSYRELSDADTGTILDHIGPDLIIADEMHCLRNRGAARTRRFLRYTNEHPECRFAGLSGTVTNDSIKDYGHLIELALRKDSPLPRGYRELGDWAGALDVKPEYHMRPGVLKQFCAPGEDVRDGYRRRLVETRGVVATEEGAIGTSLIVRRLYVPQPQSVADAIEDLDRTWAIGGEEIDSAATKAGYRRQLQTGFYYVWRWPKGVPDHEWLEARAAWNREVREKLKRSSTGMDSPKLLAQAAERYRKWDRAGRVVPRPEKAWDAATWEDWRKVRKRPKPPKEAVWISDHMVDFAITWARKSKRPCILWYWWQAVGERIAERGGFPHFGEGTDAGESKEPVIVASIRCQGTGKNLQHYSRNLVITWPSNGTMIEQLIGRTHRPGQKADEIVVEWPSFNDAAFQSSEQDAAYMQSTTGSKQKLLYATRL